MKKKKKQKEEQVKPIEDFLKARYNYEEKAVNEQEKRLLRNIFESIKQYIVWRGYRIRELEKKVGIEHYEIEE